jgi:hypothetical protein
MDAKEKYNKNENSNDLNQMDILHNQIIKLRRQLLGVNPTFSETIENKSLIY